MKKFFSLGKMNPLALRNRKEKADVAKANNAETRPAIAGEKKLVRQDMACCETGKAYYQIYEIDGDTATLLETKKLKKHDQKQSEIEKKYISDAEVKELQFQHFKVSPDDFYGGTCPFCINKGTYVCQQCGVKSCANVAEFPSLFTCPVCNLAVTHTKSKPKGSILGHQDDGRMNEEQLALPNSPVAGFLPKGKD